MMIDKRIEKWAKALVQYSIGVKKQEKILIRGSSSSLVLLREIYREVLKAGAYPEIKISENDLSEIFYKEANDDQLKYVSYTDEWIIKNFDGFIYITGDNNTKALSTVSADKLKTGMQARSKINRIFNNRSAEGKLRWVLSHYPTTGGAMESGMPLSDYEEFVMSACYLNSENPVNEWHRVHDSQEKIIDFLMTKKEFRIIAKETDLSFSTKGRKWINSDGHHNFPSGEVFTSPVEESINGHIRFSYPGIYSGKEIEDISLEFKNGKIVKFKAEKGEDLLKAVLSVDRGASIVGEAAIGTNYGINRFIKNMLFDEKIGGTVHIAIGNGFEEAGGKNKSAIHWDMLCNMKEGGKIYGDGQLFYSNGKFLMKGVKI